MGLADLERKSAQREKQGRKFGLEWECKITEQEKGRDGTVLVEEDPGEELEWRGLFGPQRETSEFKMESAEMESVW
jgi:hypothetical protein